MMDPSRLVLCLLTLFILVLNSLIIEGRLCYNCQNQPHPRDCFRVAECPTGEECFVESVVTASGNLLYNSGCASAGRCSKSTKRAVDVMQNTSLDTAVRIGYSDPKLEQSDDLVLCYSCCNDTDYCNRDKCDTSTPSVSLDNRTACLFCRNVESPDKCEFTMLCDVNEVCYTEKFRHNGEDRYRLDCVDPRRCEDPLVSTAALQPVPVGRKRLFDVASTIKYCAKCCKDGVGNCNRDLCIDGVTPRPGVSIGALIDPPPLRECEDVDVQGCRDRLAKDSDMCLNASIANFACRRTCGCDEGLIVTGGGTDTGPLLPKTDCFYESTKYQGAYKVTVTGKQCKPWTTVYQTNPATGPGFPDQLVGDAENKCRDPTGYGHPWCYTTSYLDWEYCPVPYCAECYYKNDTRGYAGYVSKDANNNTCEPWSTYNGTTPLRDSQFPGKSAKNASNYCRDVFNIGIFCLSNGAFSKCNIQECREPCHDDPKTKCELIKDFVCLKEYSRKTLCPKTCGDCNFGLLPSMKIAPPSQQCVDTVGANCDLIKDIICKNQTAARTLCPQTCNTGCGLITTQLPPQTSITTLVTSPTTMKTSPTTIMTSPTTIMTSPTTLSTTPTPTTTQDPCHDDEICKDADLLFLICKDATLGVSQCPKSCGYCDCKDVFNCSSQRAVDSFCTDSTLSVQFCKKTCNKCTEPNIKVTLNVCKDPVVLDMCPILNEELCICNDTDIRQLCEHYCEGECPDKPKVCTVPDAPTTIKKRAEILRRTMDLYNGRS